VKLVERCADGRARKVLQQRFDFGGLVTIGQ
jgi:hypothetical protein